MVRYPNLFATARPQRPDHRTGQPWACRHCGNLLGVAWPDVLQLGAARLRQAVLVECPVCGRARRWEPLPGGCQPPAEGV